MGEQTKIRQITSTKEYSDLISEIKALVQSSRTKAALSVNNELINLYFQIGISILVRQDKEGWGKSIIDSVAADLKREFPDMKGFSRRNLQDMRAFAREYKNLPNVRQLVAQIPWGHNLTIMQKVKSAEEREFYIIKTIENGWSRNVLIHQIESGLYERQGKGINNIDSVLSGGESELVKGIFKDPLVLDFTGFSEFVKESELQNSLLVHLKHFMLELGRGFAFVGEEYHLSVGGQDYYLDLLFYHTKLHCYVVIELKIDDFKPEYAGKLNFYLTAVDETVRDKSFDNPTIGILLCKERNDIVAEYSLRDIQKPMNIVKYRLSLPEEYLNMLPSAEDLSSEIKRAAIELSADISSRASCSANLSVEDDNSDE